VKFAHISDIHLGFAQFGLDEREEDVYKTFEQAIEKIINDKVEFVIFGGDIFHIPNPKGKPQMKFAKALKNLKENNISSYFVLGEHDIANAKDTPIPFIGQKFGFTNYLKNGKPFYHKNILIIGFDKFRKNEIELFKERFEEAEKEAEKHKGPKILVLHQGITEIHQYADELNSRELPHNFDYYAMGHLHDKTVERYEHLNGPIVYPGSIEHTDSQGISEKEKGFFEGEISESGITELWQSLEIRPQMSSTIEIAELDEEIEKLNKKIDVLEAKPVVQIKIKGKDVDFDSVETKITKLREKCLYLRVKPTQDDSVQGHQLLDEKPSIDIELSKLATKYLEDEKLAEFATKELLPILENKDIAAASDLVIKNYKQFRIENNA
jgi:DNA repair protein SbcD/Mre11